MDLHKTNLFFVVLHGLPGGLGDDSSVVVSAVLVRARAARWPARSVEPTKVAKGQILRGRGRGQV